MARRGKIVLKYEERVFEKRVQCVARMFVSQYGAVSFTAEELGGGARAQHDDINGVKKLLRAELEKNMAVRDWVKHFIVEMKCGDLPEDLETFKEQQRLEDIGFLFSWSPVWVGKFSDGKPCHRDNEDNPPQAGLPRDVCENKRSYFHRENQYTMIPATPENEAALEMIRNGIYGLGTKLKTLLGADRIQKTLENFPKALPMLVEPK